MYVNSGSVLAIGIIFPVLGVLAVAGRFLARMRRQVALLTDDWLCIPALLLVCATGAVMIYGSVKNIIGYDMYSQLPPPQMMEELEFIVDAMNPIGTGLIRLSFLFFYRRIFRGRSFNIISWLMIALVVSWILTFTILTFAQCRTNLWAIWTSFPEMGIHCVDTIKVLGLMGITSFILDVFILTMPFFWIWHLQMRSSQKWAVTGVFLCGAFTIGAGAMRMAAGITAIDYKPDVPQDILGLEGVNHVNGGTSIWLFWQYIEHGTGLLVCCMPTLRGLFGATGSTVFQQSSFWNSFRSFTRLSSKTQDFGSSKNSVSSDGKSGRQIEVTKTVDVYTAARQV